MTCKHTSSTLEILRRGTLGLRR